MGESMQNFKGFLELELPQGSVKFDKNFEVYPQTDGEEIVIAIESLELETFEQEVILTGFKLYDENNLLIAYRKFLTGNIYFNPGMNIKLTLRVISNGFKTLEEP